MHFLPVSKILCTGLLAITPLTSCYVINTGNREVDDGISASSEILNARHHTEAQIAAKEAAAGISNGCSDNNSNQKREAPPPDEFGPWNSEDDGSGLWLDKREPHHTEAQIAAKDAAAGNTNNCNSRKNNNKKRAIPPPDEFGPWDTEEDEFGSWLDKRDPHHTEAQIAAKNAAAGDNNNC